MEISDNTLKRFALMDLPSRKWLRLHARTYDDPVIMDRVRRIIADIENTAEREKLESYWKRANEQLEYFRKEFTEVASKIFGPEFASKIFTSESSS